MSQYKLPISDVDSIIGRLIGDEHGKLASTWGLSLIELYGEQPAWKYETVASATYRAVKTVYTSGQSPEEFGTRAAAEFSNMAGAVANGMQFMFRMMVPGSMTGYSLWGGLTAYGTTRYLIKRARRKKLDQIKENILGVLGISEKIKLQYVGHIVASQAQYPAVDYTDIAFASAMLSPLLLVTILPRFKPELPFGCMVKSIAGMGMGLTTGLCAALYSDYRTFTSMTKDYMSC
jgi:hypothetical protein